MKALRDGINVLISFVLIGFIALSLFRIAAHLLATNSTL